MSALYNQLNKSKKKTLDSKSRFGTTALGVASDHHLVTLYFHQLEGKKNLYYKSVSTDGISFKNADEQIEFTGSEGKPYTDLISSVHIVSSNRSILTSLSEKKSKKSLAVFSSLDSTHWQQTANLSSIQSQGALTQQPFNKGKYILYTGGDAIRVSQSNNLADWSVDKTILISPTYGSSIEIGNVIATRDGNLLIYLEQTTLSDGASAIALFGVLFDIKDPKKMIWKSDLSFYEQIGTINGKNISFLGIVTIGTQLASYWIIGNDELYVIFHGIIDTIYENSTKFSFLHLKRHIDNPIIKPITHHFWESKATFNPAALYENGKVHLVYRAIGDHDMSMLGYAASTDGIHIDERLGDPIYIPSEPFEYSGTKPAYVDTHSSPFASGGGGYGGVEDPRLTKVGDKIYMTYVAYDGAHPPRIALTKIQSSNFFQKNWDWDKPVLVSPPHVVDKNAVIFPDLIDGKYVFMHRIFPHILLDFVDDLSIFDGSSTFLKGQYRISPRRTHWDSRKVGAGAPPIKTPYGWLLIYHAVGDSDPGRYKMGAMLLDMKDPTKVLARSRNPILTPEAQYENEGLKYGVAYPCGAVTFNDTLFVYYGGADMVTCVATAPPDAVFRRAGKLGERKNGESVYKSKLRFSLILSVIGSRFSVFGFRFISFSVFRF